MSFSGKVVLVVGASSGIGAVTAILFSKEGADVVMIGRNEENLNNIALQCTKAPLVIKADITKDHEAGAAVTAAVKRFKRIDVLVNNAGILRYGSVLDGNLMQSYDDVVNTNLRALMYITALTAPYLIKTKGSIVNVSSVAAITSINVCFNAYCVSKAGLNCFTRCAAMELAAYGVRVNSISPGPVKTDIINNLGNTEISIEDWKQSTALKRVSAPEEVANLIMFLSSDKAQSITGSDYVMDNGFLLVK